MIIVSFNLQVPLFRCISVHISNLFFFSSYLLLVLWVQRDAKPPVCKIVDYAHDKYKKDQVGKERAKAKVCYLAFGIENIKIVVVCWVYGFCLVLAGWSNH